MIAPGSRRMSLISLHRSDRNLEISCLKLSSVKFRDFHPTVGRYHDRSDLFFALVNTLGRFVCSICVLSSFKQEAKRFQEVSRSFKRFSFRGSCTVLLRPIPSQSTLVFSLHSHTTHALNLQPTTHTSHLQPTTFDILFTLKRTSTFYMGFIL